MAKATKKMPAKSMTGERPIGVSIIAVLYYIGAVISLLGGIMVLVGSSFIGTAVPGLAGIGIIAGIIMIAMAVLLFFVGRGLWKLQNWARITAIVLAALGIVMAVYSLIGGAITSGIINILIGGLIVWYLAFKEDVKAKFI